MVKDRRDRFFILSMVSPSASQLNKGEGHGVRGHSTGERGASGSREGTERHEVSSSPTTLLIEASRDEYPAALVVMMVNKSEDAQGGEASMREGSASMEEEAECCNREDSVELEEAEVGEEHMEVSMAE